ncbi:MAG: tetratricopeptide repeat protein [Bacteroidales bacterium]|jgi:PAS domain S-box-containing protein|nr:tetratricopeptide repeat protein [Bacteroidales bacterium]
MIKSCLLLISFVVLNSFCTLTAQTTTETKKSEVNQVSDYILLAKSFYGKSVEKALTYSQMALEKAGKIQHDSILAHAHKTVGIAYYYNENPDKAIPHFDSALVLFEKLGDTKEVGNIYNNLGIMRTGIGDYNTAIEMYLKALDIRLQQSDTISLGRLYNNLGSLYYHLSSFDESLNYFTKSFEIAELQDDSTGMMSAKNNIGLVLINLNKYDEALATFRISIKIGKRNNDKLGIADSYHNLGMIHFRKDQFDSALIFYKKAADYYNQIGIESGNNCLGLGNCYFETKNYNNAITEFNKALAISYSKNDRQLRLDALRNLFETYKTSNNTNKALKAVTHYHSLFDSVKTLFDSTAVKNLLARFEIENHQREMNSLIKEQSIQQELIREQKQKLRFQKLVSYISLLFLLVLSVIIYFLFKLYRRNKKANQVLTQQNFEIEEARNSLKKSHAAIQEQEELLRTLINTTPDIICFKDAKGRWLEANQADLELFNLTGVDYKMKTDAELAEYSPTHKDALRNCIASDEIAWQKRKITRGDEEIPGPDGVIRTYDVYKIPLFNPDNTTKGLIVWGRDITNRKKEEQKLAKALIKAKESDRLKTAFLSNMSHEIRTPLNAIVGFSQLLDDETITKEEKSKFIQLILQNGESLLNLINDIISLAKIEAGVSHLNPEYFSLNKLFLELEASYKSILNQRNKKHLKWELTLPDQDVIIHTDVEKLRQVVVNLLDNAIKFTDEGGIVFGFVANFNNNQEVDDIELFVQDSGIGIAEEQQRKIFRHFTKLNDDSKKIYPGTGLGLSIVQQYVQMMGGSIKLESQPGKGTRFIIVLPHFGKARENAVKQSKLLSHQYNFEGKTILIVEDVDSSFDLLNIIIQGTRANVLRAVTGSDAVEMCVTNPDIDLVLMDIQLPQLNGLEATNRIKSFRPTLPIIAQTAFAMTEEKEACFAAGCDAYLSKPIKAELMLPVIKEIIDG